LLIFLTGIVRATEREASRVALGHAARVDRVVGFADDMPYPWKPITRWRGARSAARSPSVDAT